MARSTTTITTALTTAVAADSTLSGNMTSTSATSIWRLLVAVFAKCVNAFEAVVATYITSNEAVLAGATVGSAEWFRKRALEFQYGDDLKFDATNYYGYYGTVDTSKRKVTFCSVVNNYKINALFPGNGYILNAASGTETPAALTAEELAQLTSYIGAVTPSGLQVTVQTGTADYLALYLDVRFDSRYKATIKDTVLAAIRAYIEDLPEDTLVVNSLFKVIEDIEGVKYLTVTKVTVRDAAATVPIVLFSMINAVAVPFSAVQSWQTKFGYMLEETASSQTWADTITFTPETI